MSSQNVIVSQRKKKVCQQLIWNYLRQISKAISVISVETQISKAIPAISVEIQRAPLTAVHCKLKNGVGRKCLRHSAEWS